MAPRFPVTVDIIRQRVLETVGSRVIDADELAVSVNQQLESDVDEDVIVDICDDIVGLHLTDSGSVVNVNLALQQLTFTHRVTAEEAREHRIRIDADLAFIRSATFDFVDFDESQVDREDDQLVSPLLHHSNHLLQWVIDDFDDEDIDDFEENDERADFGEAAEWIVGPPGWLKSAAGSLVGLQLTARGEWEVLLAVQHTVSEQADLLNAALLDAIRVELRRTAPQSVRLGADTLYDWFDVMDIEVIRAGMPVHIFPPLVSLLKSGNLTSLGARVANEGINWKKDTDNRLLRQLATVWDVPFESVDAHATLMGGRLVSHVMRDLGQQDSDLNPEMSAEDRAEFRAALRTDHVARLLATHWEDSRLEDAKGELILFLNDLRTGAHDSDLAKIEWILSRLVAEPTEQAIHRANALRLDSRFLPVIEDSLLVAAARSDLNAFRTAMQRWVGVAVDRQVQDGKRPPTARESLRFTLMLPGNAPVRVVATAGRNDPCPCGSGKKFKNCHNRMAAATTNADSPDDSAGQHLHTSPLDAHALNDLLLLLLTRFDIEHPEVLNEISDLLKFRLGDEQLAGASLFVLDTQAAWRTDTEEFVSQTSAMGKSWSPVHIESLKHCCARPLSIFEVHDRAVGRSLTLRDLMSGELAVIDAPDTSRGFNVGDYALARVIGDVGTLRFAQGALHVPDRDRDATLEWLITHHGRPPAPSVCLWVLGRVGRFASASGFGSNGSVGRNTDGEALRFQRCRISVSSSFDMVNTALLASPDIDSDFEDVVGGRRWFVIDDSTLIARIVVWSEPLSDSHIAVDFEVNSVQRFQRLMEMLTHALPSFSIVAQSSDDFEDVELAKELGFPGSNVTELDGEEPFDLHSLSSEDLDKFSVEMEQRWLREKVPALGGMTPVEAAADPTRRADLIRLLNRMNGPISGPVAIGYNASRMAKQLGIDLGRHFPSLPNLPSID